MNEASAELPECPRVVWVSQCSLLDGSITPVEQLSERAVFKAVLHVHRFSEPQASAMTSGEVENWLKA